MRKHDKAPFNQEENNPPASSSEQPERPSGLIRMDDVEAERIDWMWRGRIPFGKLSLIDGDPGIGKTTLALDLAARLSRGADMPYESYEGEIGNTLIMSAEDGVADTIQPRLTVAGADLKRIYFLEYIPIQINESGKVRWEKRPPFLPDDIEHMRAIIQDKEIKYVIIDPLMAYLNGKVNAQNDQDVRLTLAPLARMAEDTKAAVVVLRHLNKMQGASPIYRGGGSIGIIGAVRSALIVARHPDDDEKYVIARNKGNLSRYCASLCYSLEDIPKTDVARVKWHGSVPYKADELLAPPKRTEATGVKEQEAIDFFMRVLADGQEHLSTDIDLLREAAGISERTAKRVRHKMGIKSRKQGKGQEGKWFMSIPRTVEDESDNDDIDRAQDEGQKEEASETDGTLGTLGNEDTVSATTPERHKRRHSGKSVKSANEHNNDASLALFEDDAE